MITIFKAALQKFRPEFLPMFVQQIIESLKDEFIDLNYFIDLTTNLNLDNMAEFTEEFSVLLSIFIPAHMLKEWCRKGESWMKYQFDISQPRPQFCTLRTEKGTEAEILPMQDLESRPVVISRGCSVEGRNTPYRSSAEVAHDLRALNELYSIRLMQIKEIAQPSLNRVQMEIIEGVINFVLDDISALDYEDAIRAFKTILNSSFSKAEVKYFQEKNIWESIAQVHSILMHPCPQNRYHGDKFAFRAGYLNGRDPVTEEEIEGANETGVHNGVVYYFESGLGSKIHTEPQGILGVNSQNHSSVLSVTKAAVVNYIAELINARIVQLQSKPRAGIC